MSDKEVSWNDDLKDWELCTFCLDVALDAAYSDGFRREDDDEYILLDDSDDSHELYRNLVFGYYQGDVEYEQD